ncbi:transglycosylase SLT domain-containing protein [Actinomycetospora atypica]|uniref:Transglycosylase SLT domain-containing protein n=1 Tax=Actinomycetospora atypica TaxID=1290095 RepID=A0ABV9YDH2_9PSEU
MAGWGYDVVGALDATPGTEALRAVAARVEQVDATALADLGRRFASLADGMDDSVRAVGRRGDSVAQAWQGPGADAFARYTADFARAGSGTGAATRQAQRELAALGRTLQTLHEEVAVHVSDALDLAGTRTDAAEVRAAVAGPTARAEAALERAEQEVADSARRLRGLTSGMSGFSRLRSPDSGASPGVSARWSDRQGATIGADDPVQAARIVDGSDSGSADGTDRPDDDAGRESGSGGGQEEATDQDDGAGRDSGSGGVQDEATGQDDGTGQDDRAERGSRADASDPGNEGRYDTGDPGSTSGDGADPSQDSSSDDSSDEGREDEPDADDDSSASADDGKADEGKADEGKADDDSAGKDTDDTAADEPANGTAPSSGTAQGPGGGPPGQVGDWIREATAILAENGVDPGDMDPDDIATIIEHESGGDPDAVNDWDSNADRGTPSKGLMQTIGPTFEANKLPGHDSITDPVDNIIAAVRYAVKRYGSVSDVPGVEAVARGDSYVGY